MDKLYPGDVVRCLSQNSTIPEGTLCTFVRSNPSGSVTVAHAGCHIPLAFFDVALYRRHMDSPLRAADDKRFWKANPIPPRSKK